MRLLLCRGHQGPEYEESACGAAASNSHHFDINIDLSYKDHGKDRTDCRLRYFEYTTMDWIDQKTGKVLHPAGTWQDNYQLHLARKAQTGEGSPGLEGWDVRRSDCGDKTEPVALWDEPDIPKRFPNADRELTILIIVDSGCRSGCSHSQVWIKIKQTIKHKPLRRDKFIGEVRVNQIEILDRSRLRAPSVWLTR